MAASSRPDPAAAVLKAPPKEARCQSCGGWLASAPATTTWVKARCGNRRCRLYGEGQTVHLRERA